LSRFTQQRALPFTVVIDIAGHVVWQGNIEGDSENFKRAVRAAKTNTRPDVPCY
jgi:hypothetical protein